MSTTIANLECTKVRDYELPTAALSFDYAADGASLLVACMDGVYQLELESGVATLLYSHQSYASGVVCIGTGTATNMVISAGYDGKLKWYDLSRRELVRDIEAHRFWSWDLARSPNGKFVASSTGQYLAGGYRYEPLPATEPTVRVYDAELGDLLLGLDHLPPVQAVAISDEFVAAANLMGGMRVWELATGKLVADWKSDDFTAFGIIKSHCYIGGIYAMLFSPEGHLLVAGMGPMRDPMAGNGRQLWQEYDWRSGAAQQTVEKRKEIKHDQAGEGLMETLCVHPAGKMFAMGGRLRGGVWNTALFDLESGDRIAAFKTDTRVTQAKFSYDGKELLLSAAEKQAEDLLKPFGRIHRYSVAG